MRPFQGRFFSFPIPGAARRFTPLAPGYFICPFQGLLRHSLRADFGFDYTTSWQTIEQDRVVKLLLHLQEKKAKIII